MNSTVIEILTTLMIKRFQHFWRCGRGHVNFELNNKFITKGDKSIVLQCYRNCEFSNTIWHWEGTQLVTIQYELVLAFLNRGNLKYHITTLVHRSSSLQGTYQISIT